MVTELEKEFFKCFGIERKRNNKVTLEAISGGVRSANLSQEPFYVYPQISDKQYLKLICLVMNTFDGIQNVYVNYSVEKVKERTLKLLIAAQDDVYNQIQTIFKEEI